MAVSTEFRPAGSRAFLPTAPREWEDGHLRFETGAAAWQDLHLTIQGERQEILGLRIGDRVVPAVAWPRRGAGHWRCRLTGPAVDETFVVTVWPKKLDPRAFDAMLADLDTRLPGSIAHGLDRAGAFAGRRSKPPRPATPAEDLARLRRAVDGDELGPGLAHCLALVARDPHTTLVADHPWAPIDRARRPSATALAAALIHPGNRRRDGDIAPLDRVFDTRARVDVDTPENRFLRDFVEEVTQRLRRAARSDRTREEAARLEACLATARRAASFLDVVGRPNGAAVRPSTTLLRRPGYREAHRRWLDFHRSSALEIDVPLRDDPFENTPALYEIWASLVAIAAHLTVCLRDGWRSINQSLVREHDGWSFALDWSGRALVKWGHPDGRVLTVFAQRTFSRAGDPIRATSSDQIPDLVFELACVGAPPRLLILDPKYKLWLDGSEKAGGPGVSDEAAKDRPVKADIDKMHAYRDALRRPDGTTATDAAFVLYPGATDEWYPDRAGGSTGVGAIGLRPGTDVSSHGLEATFERWLNATRRS